MDMKRAFEIRKEGNGWFEQFQKHQNITQLDRTIVVSLLARVLIYRDRQVEIVYNWSDEFQRLSRESAENPERRHSDGKENA